MEQRVCAIILQICRSQKHANAARLTKRMFDWNDLRYFLAVAREGSTLAAGRLLRKSQTTVARRISALEAALGLPLFQKRQAGYVVTPAGEQLLPLAERVELEAQQFADAAGASTRELR